MNGNMVRGNRWKDDTDGNIKWADEGGKARALPFFLEANSLVTFATSFFAPKERGRINSSAWLKNKRTPTKICGGGSYKERTGEKQKSKSWIWNEKLHISPSTFLFYK